MIMRNGIKKILHIHHPFVNWQEKMGDYSSIILGGVFCSKCRIDKEVFSWKKILEEVREKYENMRVYLQQPFYLTGKEEHQFFETLRELKGYKNINGILVNSPGIAMTLSESDLSKGLEIIFSRFGVRKRRTTNKYFLNQLLTYQVTGFECFDDDLILIKELLSADPGERRLKLWLRKNEYSFHSFSRTCFVSLYNGKCVNDPQHCSSGKFRLNSTKKNINLVTSGHFIYTVRNGKKDDSITGYDSLVTNCELNEL
jgi:hypothetical protein